MRADPHNWTTCEGSFIFQGILGTYCIGTDRYAFVVFSKPSRTKCGILWLDDEYLNDNYVYTDPDGFECLDPNIIGEMLAKQLPKEKSWYISKYGEKDGNEEYEFAVEEFAADHTLSLRKNGKWVPIRKGANAPGKYVFGFADPYRDPDF